MPARLRKAQLLTIKRTEQKGTLDKLQHSSPIRASEERSSCYDRIDLQLWMVQLPGCDIACYKRMKEHQLIVPPERTNKSDEEARPRGGVANQAPKCERGAYVLAIDAFGNGTRFRKTRKAAIRD